MTLTTADLDAALADDRHLGHGYATRDYIESQSKRERLDRAVVAVANDADFSAEELFHWTNSKWGRWLIDGVYGRNESPTQATVRRYLNAETLVEATEGVEVLS